MEVCIKCNQYTSVNLLHEGVCMLCETPKQDTVANLKARIAELERELQSHRATIEKCGKSLNIVWGDDFNTDSLH